MVLEVLREQPVTGLKQRAIRERYAARYGKPIAYVTLQARIRELETEGLVRRSRSGRDPFYIPVVLQPEDTRSDQGAEGVARIDAAGQIPLSDDARRSRTLVRRPRAERTPVTYEPAMLDAYEPGRTWYLPQPMRDRLRELGSTTYAGQPAGTYARDIMQRLIIDLSWGSSRLEGLKYSRIDTEEVLKDQSPQGATPLDRQLILNHKAAIEFLVEEAAAIAFNRYTILNLHALLAENLVGNPEDEGRLRTRPIGVGESVYTPTAIPQLIEERFDAMLQKTAAIPDPMEQSFFIMVHLPYLQPFIDVNKRTSRLAANISLIKSNLCPLSFVDVPEREYTEGTLAIYELRDIALLRDVFVWAYERSCAQFKVLRQSMGEPDPIRQKYRAQLRTVVADTVRSLRWPGPDTLDQLARALEVPTEDRQRFVKEAMSNLKSLRPEWLARYALRKSEFDTWTAAVSIERDN